MGKSLYATKNISVDIFKPTVVFEAGRFVLFPPPPHGLGSASVF